MCARQRQGAFCKVGTATGVRTLASAHRACAQNIYDMRASRNEFLHAHTHRRTRQTHTHTQTHTQTDTPSHLDLPQDEGDAEADGHGAHEAGDGHEHRLAPVLFHCWVSQGAIRYRVCKGAFCGITNASAATEGSPQLSPSLSIRIVRGDTGHSAAVRVTRTRARSAPKCAHMYTDATDSRDHQPYQPSQHTTRKY